MVSAVALGQGVAVPELLEKGWSLAQSSWGLLQKHRMVLFD